MVFIKKKRGLAFLLVFLLLFLNIPISKVEATSATFDFETGVGGYNTKVVTHTNGSETLRAVSVSQNLVDNDSLAGDGIHAIATDYGTDKETSITFSLLSGNQFDLKSLRFIDYSATTEYIKISSSKGEIVSDDINAQNVLFNVSSKPNSNYFVGITSFTITASDGLIDALAIDDIFLDNIIPQLSQVTGVSLSSSGVASWNNVLNESSYDVQLYKGGVLQGTAVNVAADTLSYDFLSTMRTAGAGVYTVRVTAKGDNINYGDGTQSTASGSQTIAKLATVNSGLTWTGDVAHWTGVANATNYTVEAFKNGISLGTADVLAANIASGLDLSAIISSNGSGTYTYKVTAKADATSLYLDADQSVASNNNVKALKLSKVQNVALSSSGVASWDNIASESSYDVQLFKNGIAQGSVVNKAADTLNHDFLSTMRTAGVGAYTVKVTAKGNGTTTTDSDISDESNTRSIVQLSDVSAGLTWTGNIAHWTGVANATNYDVQLYKDSVSVGSPVNVLTANVSSGVDFSNEIASNGGGTYTYKVTAKGDNTLLLDASISASSNNNVVATPLSQVTGVVLSGSGVASWNNVSNESSYDVQLYKDGVAEGSAVNVSADVLTYDFLSTMRTSGEGTYTVKVKAKGDGSTYSDGLESAASVSQSIAKLTTVTAGISWTGDIAHWTGVANATSYEVQLYKDGTILGSAVNVLAANIASGVDFSSTITSNGGGTYTYKVVPKSNSTTLYIDGVQSASSNDNIKATQLSQVTGVAISGLGIATWNDVSNESSYDLQLYKDGIAEGSVVNLAANTLTYDFLSTMRSSGVGEYTVKVVAKGNGSTYSDSLESAVSNSRTIVQLSNVNSGLNWVGNVAHWTGVANATNYDVQLYKAGIPVDSPINVTLANITQGADFSSIILNNGIGTYSYKVTAKGDQILLLNGSASVSSPDLVITTLDTTLPVVGGGGNLSASDLTSNSVNLSWIAGTDNETSTSNLEYKLVQSTSNNINTVILAEQNGNVIQDWAKNVTTAQAIGLTPNTTYYFNVIVKDEAGNKNIYNMLSQTTLPNSSVTTQHAISFEVNGGTAIPTQMVDDGSKAVRPSNPTKNGYTFVDWYQESSLNNVFDFNTSITTSATIYAKWSSSSSSGGSSSSGSTNQPQNPTPGQNTDIIINGEKYNIGKEVITKNGNGESEAKVTVQKDSILKQIDAVENQGSNNVQVTVGTKDADKVVIGLTGDIIKSLENRNFDLSIQKDDVKYQLPAKEFTIDKIAEKLGVSSSELQKIDISITIQKPSKELLQTIEEKSKNVNFVVSPVQFELKALVTDSSGQTKEVVIDKFGQYIERTIDIPEGIDPSKITTGIVFNNDSTFEHVPTVVIKDGDKWVAKINSRTNSTYSVVYHPITIKAVENHWSKTFVNDMASRMVIVETSNFKPDEAITRAEFADYIVRGLGLFRKDTNLKSEFKDVSENNNYTTSIMIAKEYGIIAGYSDGTFKPNDKITREEAMLMFVNAMNITELKVTENNELRGFSDVEKVSKWAKDGVQKSIASKIFNGRSKDKIEPQGIFTKAEAATAIRNLLIEAKLINK